MQAGDQLGEVEGVGADIAEAAAKSGASRIGAPFRLLVAFGVERTAQPALDIFHLHQPDRTKVAAGDAGARLFDQRIARIGEGEGEVLAAGLRGGGDGAGFLAVHRHRLFAEDVETCIQRGNGDGCMEVVRGDDRHRVDPFALRQRRFAREQRGIGRIDPRRIEPEQVTGPRILARIGAECAGRQLPVAVERRGHAMDGADERALAAADHAEPERMPDHASPRSRPRRVRIAPLSTPLEAKSSNARSVTRMIWSRINGAPSRAPSSLFFSAHSHSITAQPR